MEKKKKERKKGKRDGVYRGSEKEGVTILLFFPNFQHMLHSYFSLQKDKRKDKARRVISDGPPISPRDGKSASGMLPWQLRG